MIQPTLARPASLEVFGSAIRLHVSHALRLTAFPARRTSANARNAPLNHIWFQFLAILLPVARVAQIIASLAQTTRRA